MKAMAQFAEALEQDVDRCCGDELVLQLGEGASPSSPTSLEQHSPCATSSTSSAYSNNLKTAPTVEEDKRSSSFRVDDISLRPASPVTNGNTVARLKRSPIRGVLRALSSITITDIEAMEDGVSKLRNSSHQPSSQQRDSNPEFDVSASFGGSTPTTIRRSFLSESEDLSPLLPVRSTSRVSKNLLTPKSKISKSKKSSTQRHVVDIPERSGPSGRRQKMASASAYVPIMSSSDHGRPAATSDYDVGYDEDDEDDNGHETDGEGSCNGAMCSSRPLSAHVAFFGDEIDIDAKVLIKNSSHSKSRTPLRRIRRKSIDLVPDVPVRTPSNTQLDKMCSHSDHGAQDVECKKMSSTIPSDEEGEMQIERMLHAFQLEMMETGPDLKRRNSCDMLPRLPHWNKMPDSDEEHDFKPLSTINQPISHFDRFQSEQAASLGGRTHSMDGLFFYCKQDKSCLLESDGEEEEDDDDGAIQPEFDRFTPEISSSLRSNNMGISASLRSNLGDNIGKNIQDEVSDQLASNSSQQRRIATGNAQSKGSPLPTEATGASDVGSPSGTQVESPFRVREFVVALRDFEGQKLSRSERSDSGAPRRRPSYDSLPTPPKRRMDGIVDPRYGTGDGDNEDDDNSSPRMRRSFGEIDSILQRCRNAASSASGWWLDLSGTPKQNGRRCSDKNTKSTEKDVDPFFAGNPNRFDPDCSTRPQQTPNLTATEHRGRGSASVSSTTRQRSHSMDVVPSLPSRRMTASPCGSDAEDDESLPLKEGCAETSATAAAASTDVSPSAPKRSNSGFLSKCSASESSDSPVCDDTTTTVSSTQGFGSTNPYGVEDRLALSERLHSAQGLRSTNIFGLDPRLTLSERGAHGAFNSSNDRLPSLPIRGQSNHTLTYDDDNATDTGFDSDDLHSMFESSHSRLFGKDDTNVDQTQASADIVEKPTTEAKR